MHIGVIAFGCMLSMSCAAGTGKPPIVWDQTAHAGAGFKSPLELKSGDILVVETEGIKPKGQRIICLKSADYGMTWSFYGEIARDENPADMGDGHMIQLRNGDLLYSYRHNRGWGPAEKREYRLEVAISKDGGRHWQRHSEVANSIGCEFGLWSTFLLEKKDGTIQCYYDDERAPANNGLARHQWLTMKTWDPASNQWINPVTVSRAHNPEHLSRDGMCSVVEVSRNKLLCAFETVQVAPPHRGVLMTVTSEDGGKSWSWTKEERHILYQPRDINFNALAPWVIMLSDGRLLCVFTTDEDRKEPGVAATSILSQDVKCIVSRDGGRTWSKPYLVDGNYPCYFPGVCELLHGKQPGSVLVQYGGSLGHTLKTGRLTDGK
jgi:hypothetical protein